MDGDRDRLFKCSECEAKFNSLDLLGAHQRRHDMSLNLSTKLGASMPASTSTATSSLSTPSILKGSISAGIIGFVDETPTPTRFFRNCEEVGLFQAMQNVNPFDEDFKKAATSSTSTPSGEGVFEFSFASGTPTNLDSNFSWKNVRSKRRYSDQDTLNTPQVFPYFGSTGGSHTLTTNTASMSACLTPTPQNVKNSAGGSQETLRSIIQNHSPQVQNTAVSTTSYNHEEHVSIISFTSAISQKTNKEPGSAGSLKLESPRIASDLITKGFACTSSSCNVSNNTGQGGKLSSLRIRSKSNLKLDLKTVISRTKPVTQSPSHKSPGSVCKQTESVILKHQESVANSSASATLPSTENSNCKKELLERNRAAAYRSRERRKEWIYGLESRCRALEALLAESQSEVLRLKAENDTLKAQLNNQSKDHSSDITPIFIATVEAVSNSTPILIQRQPEQCKVDLLVQVSESEDTSLDKNFSPILLPKNKAKRGRPRKGEERRVPVVAVPIINSGKDVKELPKIPILPLSKPRRKKKS